MLFVLNVGVNFNFGLFVIFECQGAVDDIGEGFSSWAMGDVKLYALGFKKVEPCDALFAFHSFYLPFHAATFRI